MKIFPVLAPADLEELAEGRGNLKVPALRDLKGAGTVEGGAVCTRRVRWGGEVGEMRTEKKPREKK